MLQKLAAAVLAIAVLFSAGTCAVPAAVGPAPVSESGLPGSRQGADAVLPVSEACAIGGIAFEEDAVCGGAHNCPCGRFLDMPAARNWAHTGIDFCVRLGLFSGTSATTFEPGMTLTRAMLVTVLWRLSGSPEGGTAQFDDVPDGKWFTQPVRWAAEAGVVYGVDSRHFAPEQPVTREQTAAILCRFVRAAGYPADARAELGGFTDREAISAYAVDDLCWAVGVGILRGDGGGTVRPRGRATRAEAAAMLMRCVRFCLTLDLRDGKAEQLAGRFDAYDSYLIGSTSAAPYRPAQAEAAFGGSFYNLFHYGSDTDYDRLLVEWLLHSDDVRTIVLVLGLKDADTPGSSLTDAANVRFPEAEDAPAEAGRLPALPGCADFFPTGDGCLDDRFRDAETIRPTDVYLGANAALFPAPAEPRALGSMDACLDNVRQIAQMCEQAGTELEVIVTPAWEGELAAYTEESLRAFFDGLTGITDNWNFAASALSRDARFFYDAVHARGAAADLVLTRMGGGTAACPENFGVFCPRLSGESAPTEPTGETKQQRVGILMYHLTEADSAESFAHQMQLIRDCGFTPVSLDALHDYVYYGTPLPEKAVAITFDDGYLSNYEVAYPILQQYQYPATIFAIGCSIGHYQYYKDTLFELNPHFGQPEIDEMRASGLISIHSHTYDMHQWAPFESGDRVRDNMLMLPGETPEEYEACIRRDVALQDETFAGFGLPQSRFLAFPEGARTRLTDAVLMDCGFEMTFATLSAQENILVQGLPQSLLDLRRRAVSKQTGDEQFVADLSDFD